jgi:hypothetical protein
MTKKLCKDLLIWLFSVAGLLSVLCGEFVLSTTLFGLASVSTNLDTEVKVGC